MNAQQIDTPIGEALGFDSLEKEQLRMEIRWLKRKNEFLMEAVKVLDHAQHQEPKCGCELCRNKMLTEMPEKSDSSRGFASLAAGSVNDKSNSNLFQGFGLRGSEPLLDLSGH